MKPEKSLEVNQGILPLETSSDRSSDIVVKKQHEMHERALLYVSATRAKKDVWVTSYGRGRRFLEDFEYPKRRSLTNLFRSGLRAGKKCIWN